MTRDPLEAYQRGFSNGLACAIKWHNDEAAVNAREADSARARVRANAGTTVEKLADLAFAEACDQAALRHTAYANALTEVLKDAACVPPKS